MGSVIYNGTGIQLFCNANLACSWLTDQLFDAGSSIRQNLVDVGMFAWPAADQLLILQPVSSFTSCSPAVAKPTA